MKALCSFEKLVYAKIPVTQCNISKDQDQPHRCGYLKFHILKLLFAVIDIFFITETVCRLSLYSLLNPSNMYKYVTQILMETNFEHQPHTKLQGYLYTSPPSPCGENVLKVSTII
jgi:hypothetical protein